jgi:hypothetical protein
MRSFPCPAAQLDRVSTGRCPPALTLAAEQVVSELKERGHEARRLS